MRKDRQAQQANDNSVRKKNPFSPENMAARKSKLMDKLREERGIPTPAPKTIGADGTQGAAYEQAKTEATPVADSRNDGDQQSQIQRDTSAPVPQASDAQMEWYKREQAVQQAEARVREAETASQKRIAEAEAKEAKANERLQKMDWARANPIEFMAEAGMTQDEWSAFLTNGGKLSPEQKRVREMERQLAETNARMKEMMERAEANERKAAAHAEEAAFSQHLSKYELVQQMGGIAAIRNKQGIMAQATGSAVSLAAAAEALENEMQAGLSGLLNHPGIRNKLGLSDVDKSQAGPIGRSPRTLNQSVSSETPPREPSLKGPLDWEGRRRLYHQRMEAERRNAVKG